MYYMLENYYQNHRRYVKSRSDQQLRGAVGLTSSQLADCAPRAAVDPDGADTVKNAINPCGLIAWSLFNDTYTLRTPAGKLVPLSKAGIAWDSDVERKFKNTAETGANFPAFAGRDCSPGSGQCSEDEDFIVWMRTAGLPTFRKLYRRIPTSLEPGDYALTIQNGVGATPTNPATGKAQTQLYPVHPFGGTKSVVLTTTSYIGGKNDFLGYAYIIVGARARRVPTAARAQAWSPRAQTARARARRSVPLTPCPCACVKPLPSISLLRASRRHQPRARDRFLHQTQALAAQARRHLLPGLVQGDALGPRGAARGAGTDKCCRTARAPARGSSRGTNAARGCARLRGDAARCRCAQNASWSKTTVICFGVYHQAEGEHA